MLTLTGIGKMYGHRVIFRNVSLHVTPGTVSLLAGANGAGKTTLLRIMAGLARPTTGSITRTCTEGQLAYLGHATFIYPGLTARENLLFWSRLHGLSPSSAAIEALLERVDLVRFADERAGAFSRGMAQRLNLARVLLQSPALLLLDEPGTGLDSHSRTLLYREILTARAQGAAVIWISHDIAADACHADRILTLAGRTLAYDGTPEAYPGLETIEERLLSAKGQRPANGRAPC